MMIQEADFAALHDLGFNAVRLPFNYRILMNLSEPFVWRDYGWNLLDKVIDWAEAHCIYVVSNDRIICMSRFPFSVLLSIFSFLLFLLKEYPTFFLFFAPAESRRY